MIAKLRPFAVIVLFSVIYFPLSCTLASWKAMWHDEILTYHLARLPDLPTLWAALRSGPDFSGPLHFLSVRLAYGLLGETPLATRLPAIIGVWVMALCLYAFVSHRTSPIVAIAAMLFPLSTELYLFIIEARPYGIWLGFTGISLLFWQSATADRARRLTLLGLALSLAGAVASQYNAVLIFIPLGIAEIARAWWRRRSDFPLWLAIVSGLAPLVPCIPFINNARRHLRNVGPPIGFMEPVRTVVTFYEWLLKDSIPPLIGSLILVALALTYYASLRTEENPELDEPPFPMHEVVVASALIFLPFFLIILDKLRLAHFMARYCLPSAVGFGILFPALIARLRGRIVAGSVLACIFLGWFVLNFASRAILSNAYSGQEERENPLLVPTGDGLPVATHDEQMFTINNYYSNNKLNSKFFFITGLRDDDLTDHDINKLRPWVSSRKPLMVQTYGDFIAAHDRFLVYGNPNVYDKSDMLIERLRSEGAEVKRIDAHLIKFGGSSFEVPVFEVRSANSRKKVAGPDPDWVTKDAQKPPASHDH